MSNLQDSKIQTIKWNSLPIGTIFENNKPYQGEGQLLFIGKELTSRFVCLIHINHTKNINLNGQVEYKDTEHLEEFYTIKGELGFNFKSAEEINKFIQTMDSRNKNLVSDGYHTFEELYEFRKMYNAALFNIWAKQDLYNVHKSWNHHDEPGCFGEIGRWFIVCAKTPDGLISNHYKAEDWDLFQIPEHSKAIFPYDGHTVQDVLIRLAKLK